MIEEAENLLCEADGVVVVGIFTRVANWELLLMESSDFRPLGLEGESPIFWRPPGRYLPDTHVCFSDRVRHNKGEKGIGKRQRQGWQGRWEGKI